MKNLIEAVKKIDPEAAGYLEKEVKPRYDDFPDKLKAFEKYTDMRDLLCSVFIWGESPQGNKFWKNIFLKLK